MTGNKACAHLWIVGIRLVIWTAATRVRSPLAHEGLLRQVPDRKRLDATQRRAMSAEREVDVVALLVLGDDDGVAMPAWL